MEKERINTTEKDWLKKLAEFYKRKVPFTLVDDANLGINPDFQSLLQMGKKAGVPAKDWIGVLVSLGLSTFGAYMVAAAILDPEPTSKLELMILSGAILTFSGGMMAIKILTKVKPPKVSVNQNGFTVEWDDYKNDNEKFD